MIKEYIMISRYLINNQFYINYQLLYISSNSSKLIEGRAFLIALNYSKFTRLGLHFVLKHFASACFVLASEMVQQHRRCVAAATMKQQTVPHACGQTGNSAFCILM